MPEAIAQAFPDLYAMFSHYFGWEATRSHHDPLSSGPG
jgi:hypothetical protein